jgi:hypothetical protein
MATISNKSTRPGNPQFKPSTTAQPKAKATPQVAGTQMTVGNLGKGQAPVSGAPSPTKIRGTGAATKGLYSRGPMA